MQVQLIKVLQQTQMPISLREKKGCLPTKRHSKQAQEQPAEMKISVRKTTQSGMTKLQTGKARIVIFHTTAM